MRSGHAALSRVTWRLPLSETRHVHAQRCTPESGGRRTRHRPRAPAWAAGDSPITAYREYVDAYSRGQIDEALARFADDAVVTAGPDCTPWSPCAGKVAIRERYLAPLMAARVGAPLLDQRFDGTRLTTRGEVSVVVGPEQSVTQLRGGHAFAFRAGRISSLAYELDLSDGETARYIARLSARARVAQLGGR